MSHTNKELKPVGYAQLVSEIAATQTRLNIEHLKWLCGEEQNGFCESAFQPHSLPFLTVSFVVVSFRLNRRPSLSGEPSKTVSLTRSKRKISGELK